MELLRKLGQRETWLYLAGIGVAIYGVAAPALGIEVENAPSAEAVIGIVAALTGPGALAHIKRGEQRGKVIVETVLSDDVRQALKGDEEEEGPWN